jgi:DNA-binding IclR family transcriptional regulator
MNSLGRALKLLEMMGRHSGGLTNSQISRFLHISTSSTSYLLSQLEREGCVKRDEDTARYQVGLRLVSLAQGAQTIS